MKPTTLITLFIIIYVFQFCSNSTHSSPQIGSSHLASNEANKIINKKGNKESVKTIHVFVALCDNKYQGIVPVGKTIGNGQDEDNNLYWGCDYGVRTYFKKKTSDWNLVQSQKNVSAIILERILFKHKTKNIYLLADAYDGQFIKQTTIDFLLATSGQAIIKMFLKNDTIYFGGASNIVSYIGHNGLMDFSLPLQKKSTDTTKKETIILACYSKNYFTKHLQQTNATPLIWTTGLMAPEAYTLHDALQVWANKTTPDKIQLAAATAYAKYQKCSIKAAKNLLVTGW